VRYRTWSASLGNSTYRWNYMPKKGSMSLRKIAELMPKKSRKRSIVRKLVRWKNGRKNRTGMSRNISNKKWKHSLKHGSKRYLILFRKGPKWSQISKKGIRHNRNNLRLSLKNRFPINGKNHLSS